VTRGRRGGATGPRAILVACAIVASACDAGPHPASVPTHAPGERTVYVAIGASDALGIGTADPIRQAWPQVFFDEALPLGSTFVNLAVAGSTVASALQEQLPYVGSLGATVVTVFLGVNDLRADVSPATYGEQLRTLLSGLRAAGSPLVLVANVPPLDRLPAYLACLPDPPPSAPPCSIADGLPTPPELRRDVAAYDGAVADAAAATGATGVDLHAAGLRARSDGTDASLVSPDGFHPSAAGNALIASVFAAAYRRVTSAHA
jgi:lysophospholipase L1-like esterase